LNPRDVVKFNEENVASFMMNSFVRQIPMNSNEFIVFPGPFFSLPRNHLFLRKLKAKIHRPNQYQKVEFRSISGYGNNRTNLEWGSPGVQLLRMADPAYADDRQEPRGGFVSSLPSPRLISNTISDFSVSQATDQIGNPYNYTDWLWQWGQFIDHDISLTEPANPAEHFFIDVPQGDPYFDPAGSGTMTIAMDRSIYDITTGKDHANPRQQINEITAYLDASMVYGSDPYTAARLRAWDGKGRLLYGVAENGEEVLPLDSLNTGNTSFLAGDKRVNEQIGLTAIHTLFLREHNRIAENIWNTLHRLSSPPGRGKQYQAERKEFRELRKEYGSLLKLYRQSGLSLADFAYQSARRIVGAEIQAITYNEFLPLLIGAEAIPAYEGYDQNVNVGISNEFSTAAYRVGHTMLSPQLLRVDGAGAHVEIPLRDAFFTPDSIASDGVDTLLLGLASQQAQAVDSFIVSDVRNFLFGPPGAGGFDLASLNIQRGRDHGLPSLNTVRQQIGLEPYTSFDAITGCEAAFGQHDGQDPDCELARRFESIYGSVDDVDLWIGGLAEPHLPGAAVGETFQAIISDQFTRLRDGDRFWYENDPVMIPLEAFMLPDVTLSDVIRVNSAVIDIQDQAFIMAAPGI
jgi:peroxidase